MLPKLRIRILCFPNTVPLNGTQFQCLQTTPSLLRSSETTKKTQLMNRSLFIFSTNQQGTCANHNKRCPYRSANTETVWGCLTDSTVLQHFEVKYHFSWRVCSLGNISKLCWICGPHRCRIFFGTGVRLFLFRVHEVSRNYQSELRRNDVLALRRLKKMVRERTEICEFWNVCSLRYLLSSIPHQKLVLEWGEWPGREGMGCNPSRPDKELIQQLEKMLCNSYDYLFL